MIVIGFPWRPTADRVAAFDVVQRWYSEAIPDAKQVICDAGGKAFNRSESRNQCVRRAEELGAQIVVVSDADTVPSLTGIHAAIEAALQGGLHYPFDQYLYAGTDLPPGGNTGGIYVCRPDVWWAFGGCDPRFGTQWGGEDDAVHAAAECLVGPPTHHPGWAVSLPHSGACRTIGSAEWVPNSQLALRYHNARHNPQGMRSLIAERP